eukprot:sb/3467159/
MDVKCFYKVRIQALHSLAQCVSGNNDPTVNEDLLISLFQSLSGEIPIYIWCCVPRDQSLPGKMPIQSDPYLVTPYLVTPRFSDMINFPRYRKVTVFDPDLVPTPIYAHPKSFPPRMSLNRGPTVYGVVCHVISSADNETIPRMNNFTDFPQYFLQQDFMRAIGSVKDQAGMTTRKIVNFLSTQLHYNDNQSNEYDDSYLIVAIIDGLTSTIPLKVDPKAENHLGHVKQILPKIVSLLNIDKKMPSYQQIVSSACLRFIAKLIRHGHIMDNLKDSSIFSAHLKKGQSLHVRCTAIQQLARFVKVRESN